MTTRMPVDELGRRASEAVDRAMSTLDAPPPVDVLRRRLRRRHQRRIVAVTAGVVALAGVLVVGIVGGGDTPVIVDQPNPEVTTPEPATVTRDGWTLGDDEDTFGGQGAQVVMGGDTAWGSGVSVLVGMDGANAAEGHTRPGVWLTEGGEGWRRVDAGSIGVSADWDEAGVLMRGVAVSDDGLLVAVGGADFLDETREQAVAWSSADGGRTWSHTAVSGRLMEAVTWDGERFVAVGSSGGSLATWTSVDGASWQQQPPTGGEGAFYDVAIHAGRLVAVSTVGDSSQIWVADPAAGVQWEPVELPTGGTLSALYSDGSVLYAVGTHRPDGLDHDGLLLTSADGTAWQIDGRSEDLGGPDDQLPVDLLVDGDELIVAGWSGDRAAIWTSTAGGPLRALSADLFPARSQVGTLVTTTDSVLAVGSVERETGPDVLLWSRNRETSAVPITPPATTCESDDPPAFAGVPEAWSALAPPPAPRARAGTVWTGDRLLMVGGDSNFGGSRHPSVFSYDPPADQWSCLADAPFSASANRIAWTGELLYAWGGNTAATYEPATDTWQQLPDPPEAAPTDPVVVTWTGAELIVWGSTSRRDSTATGVAYNPDDAEWRVMADGPLPLNQAQAIWTGDELIVYGAHLDGNNRSTTETSVGAAYDPAGDTWRELPPFDLSPQAASIAWTGSELIAWDYALAAGSYDPTTDTWTRLPDLPLEFGECYPDSAVLDDDRVFAWFCGQAAILNPDTNSWTQIETPITTRWGRPAAEDEVEQIAGRPVAAGTTVYFAGAAHEGHANALWRWQPTP